MSLLRQFLFGRALATAQEKHERLPKVLALPILSSDALSSNAYATEEILLTLLLLGSIAHVYSVPISAAI
ncbi:MAG: amino acid permease, partial [Armatimonadetes bacterium]|nr:amino acid permease [Armatimonadota bacterium]